MRNLNKNVILYLLPLQLNYVSSLRSTRNDAEHIPTYRKPPRRCSAIPATSCGLSGHCDANARPIPRRPCPNAWLRCHARRVPTNGGHARLHYARPDAPTRCEHARLHVKVFDHIAHKPFNSSRHLHHLMHPRPLSSIAPMTIIEDCSSIQSRYSGCVYLLYGLPPLFC